MIGGLFSREAKGRVKAYQELISQYGKREELIPALLQYANDHFENDNGIYNALIVATDFTRSPSDRVGLVNEIVHDRPLAWLGTHSKQKTLRLALYAHGGLNSQNESMQRIRVLAPCFLAKVYPLFMTWKTGPGETIADMAQDWLRRLFAGQDKLATGWFDDLAEQRDLAFENWPTCWVPVSGQKCAATRKTAPSPDMAWTCWPRR